MSKNIKILIVVILALIMAGLIIWGNRNFKEFQNDISKRPDINGSKDLSQDKDEPTKKDIKSINLERLQKRKINVVVIGDQISQSVGIEENKQWVNLFLRDLTESYDLSIKTTDIRGYNKGFFSSWVDYCENFEAYNLSPDIVLISVGEAVSNSKETNYKVYYENLIRKILRKNIYAHIVFVAQHLIGEAYYYSDIKKISEYYEVEYLDMNFVFEKYQGDKSELYHNNNYLKLAGNNMYADQTTKAFNNYLSTIDKLEYFLPEAIDNSLYLTNSGRISILLEPSNLLTSKVEQLGRRYFLVEKLGDFLTGRFVGNILGLNVLKTKDSGHIKVYVDEKFIKEVDLYNDFSNVENILISDNLNLGDHLFRIEFAGTKDTYSLGELAYIFGYISKK